MTQAKRMRQRREADRLFSRIVRSRGACERCGSREHLQCAHIISRRYLAVRWTEGNAVCLCRGCHMWGTHHPLEWERWVREHIGNGIYLSLRAYAISGERVDYDAILERLRAREQELGL